MSRLLPILISLWLAGNALAIGTVNFVFSDIFGGTTNGIANRQVDIYPQSALAISPLIVLTDYKPRKTDTNGQLSATLVGPATYRVVFEGVFSNTTFYITLTNNSGTWNAADISSVSTNGNSATMGYSMGAANAHFVEKLNSWSSGQTLTNPAIPQGAVSGYVWTATNSNGHGEWQVGGGAGSGEANLLGNYGTTNAGNGHISIVGPKSGVTLQALTISPGAGIIYTNEGTNVVTAAQINLSSSAQTTGTLPVGNGGLGGSAPAANNGVLIGNGTIYQPTPLATYNGLTFTNTPGTRLDFGLTGIVAIAGINISNVINANSLTVTGLVTSASNNISGGLSVGGPYSFTNFPGATATNLTTSNTVWLSTAGNDSTAQRGNAAKAYLTPTNAIAALQSGDTLMWLGGNYSVNTFGSPSVTIANSNGAALNIRGKTNITILGVGRPQLVLTNNITVLQLWDVSGFNISGLVFNYTNKPAGDKMTNLVTVIDISGGSRNGHVENCDFLNFPDQGICAALSYGFRNQSNVVASGNYFYGGGITNGLPGHPANTQDGACIVPASHWIMVNNKMESCVRGVEWQLNTVEGDAIYGGILAHNEFYAMLGDEISLYGLGTDSINDVIIEGNISRNHLYNGTGPYSVLWADGGGLTRVAVRNNSFYGSSPAGTGAGAGIAFGASGTSTNRDCVIEGNLCTDFSFACIQVNRDATSISTNITISRNKTTGAAYGIYVGGTGQNIVGNECKGAANAGIYMEDVSGANRGSRLLDNIITDCPIGVQMVLGASNNVSAGNLIARASTQRIIDANSAGFNFHGPNIVGTNGAAFYGTNDLESTRVGFANLYKGTNTGASDFAALVTHYASTIHKGGVSNEVWQTTAGPSTNLDLTASRAVFTDANKRLVSGTLGADYLDSTYISDTAFANSWDGVTTIAPSKNAVFDRLVLDQTGSAVLSNLVGTVANNLTNTATGWGIQLSTTTGTLTANATNALTLMPTNAVTFQADFTGGTPLIQTADFMRTNVTVYLTNPIAGRVMTFCFRGDGNAVDRTVTLATNGLTGNWPIHWGFNTPTNGATAFTVTNNIGAELSILVKSNAFSAFWGPQR